MIIIIWIVQREASWLVREKLRKTESYRCFHPTKVARLYSALLCVYIESNQYFASSGLQ